MLRILIDDKIPERVSSEMILALPQWRREKAEAFRFSSDQWLCARAYQILCQGLRDEFGITEMPQFEYGKNGKPSLMGFPDVHFNISHCPRAVAVVISDAPIGCDVEAVIEDSQLDEDVMLHCFNGEEVAEIRGAEHPGVEFTRLWTVKEALLKLTGEGLTENLPKLLSRADLQDVSIKTTDCGTYVFTIAQRELALE